LIFLFWRASEQAVVSEEAIETAIEMRSTSFAAVNGERRGGGGTGTVAQGGHLLWAT
jgi:hypothetical protein